jgi:hypothetical protein
MTSFPVPPKYEESSQLGGRDWAEARIEHTATKAIKKEERKYM